MAKLKTARGRGNQGDWAKSNTGKLAYNPKLHAEQRKHNEEVEAKRKRRKDK